MTLEILPLNEEYFVPAFELATKTFVEGSTLHKALGIGLEEYRSYLHDSFENMLAEGLSVVAIEKDTGNLLGCLIATDFYKTLDDGSKVSDRFKPLVELTNVLCWQYQSHRSVEAGKIMLVDMGAVTCKVGSRGIYQHMRNATQTIAKSKGFSYVVGELSSTVTQHVVINKLGHEKIAEIAFSDFELDGKYPFRSIKEPSSIILAEGKL